MYSAWQSALCGPGIRARRAMASAVTTFGVCWTSAVILEKTPSVLPTSSTSVSMSTSGTCRPRGARFPGQFIQADLTKTDFSRLGTFDMILANSFFHHLTDSDVERILAQLTLLLAPEGTIHILDLVLPDRPSPCTDDGAARSRQAREGDRAVACIVRCGLRTDRVRTVIPRRQALVDGLFSGAEKVVKLSVGIPVFNEQEVLPGLLARLLPVLDGIEGGPHEVIFVDDGSSDSSRRLLEDASARDPRIRVVVLSRNFGHQAALGAALDYATGDAVVLMDADLQDQPEVIPDFIARHHAGADVVFARRHTREEGWLLRLAYRAFYRIISALSDTKLPLDTGDFALLGRPVVDALRRLPEHERYFGAARVGGVYQCGIDVDRTRAPLISRNTRWKLMKLAVDGIAVLYSAPARGRGDRSRRHCRLHRVFRVRRVCAGCSWTSTAGFTASLVIMTFLSGVQLLFLGVIGEYLGRVYGETKGRPPYVVARVMGRD